MLHFFKFLAVLCLLSFLIWGGARFYTYNVSFERSCNGHLERARVANSVPLAIQELEMTVRYLENNGMTSGYTSLAYNTPDEDMGYVYQNLKSALEQLKALPSDADAMTRSNMLLKLHESLSKGFPEGAEIFPDNRLFALWAVLSLVFMVIFGIIGFSDLRG